DDEPVAAAPSRADTQEEPALAIPPDEDRPGVVSGPEGPAPVMDDEAPAAIGSYVGVAMDDEAPPEAAGRPPEAVEAETEVAEAAPADELPAPVDEPPPAPPVEEPAPALVLGDDSPLPVDDTGLGIEVQVEPGLTDEVSLEVELEVRPDAVEEVEEVDAEAVEVAEPAEPHVTPTPPPLPIAPAAAPAPEPERAWEPLDAELDEVEFYERQGLLDEALLAVRELAEVHPGHPAVQPLLERIEAAAAAAEGEETSPAPDPEALRAALSPVVAAPPPVPPPPAVTPYPAPKPAPTPTPVPAQAPVPTPVPAARPRRPVPGSTGTTGIFDLGAELSAELGPELTPTPTGEFQYSVADVFDQFKKGLEKTVRPDDSATMYDLGIAFQEMGMLDEALEQFRSALAGGDRRREVEILSMIGNCLGLKGQHAEAIDAYRQALASEFLTGEAAKALHFELGAAHEAVGEVDQAIWYFQKVANGDPSYRGVAGRVARLGGGGGVAPTSRGAHGPGTPSGKKPRKR
ncbi:MAG TPA: hypothetical protein VFM45_06070, partial [Anaeromyxobacteraceae bacterium]|nr:hypothetical protein [Anaeromyxobacteraceae bacterium]